MEHVRESRLIAMLQRFADYRYSWSKVVYPWPLRGFPHLRTERGSDDRADLATNCCTFLEGLLVRAFQEKNPDMLWSRALHRAFMIIPQPHAPPEQGGKADIFGPVHAAIESGMAEPRLQDDLVGDWLLVQGWNKALTRGHTFVVVRVEGERVLVLEANNTGATVRGVGYRGLGRVADFPLPPKPPEHWKLKHLRSAYPVRRAVPLRVILDPTLR